MSSCAAIVTPFDREGRLLQVVHMSLPEYLDWMPIELKVFWFLARGEGDPRTERFILASQGEVRLVEVKEPLRNHTWQEMKEKEHGLEGRIEQYRREQGFSRTPRNQ